MIKRLTLVLVTIMLVCVPMMASYAERVSAGTIEDKNLCITDDNRPFVNAVNNVQNNGWLVTDGEYLYCRTGGNTHVARLYDDFTGEVIMDNILNDCAFYYQDGYIYVRGRHNGKAVEKTRGIWRFKVHNGYMDSEPERIVNASVYNYTIDERYIYYQVEGETPIYRIDMQKYNGGASLKESRITIASHPIRSKNIICRMMVNGDTLYYINDKDHCMYGIPCHEPDSSYAAMGGSINPARVSNIPMHYFILTAYKGEMIAIFTKYASSNDELNKARLGAIYMSNGEPVKELSFLEQIRSRYINTMGGYLYYCDSADDKNLYRVELKETSSPRFEEIKSGMSLGYPLCFSDWVFADCVDENGVFYAYNISTNTGKVFRIRSDY